MSLFISSLNSGSSGNCYYIGNETEAVLIDAGISCRELDKRMLKLGLNIANVKAVFISHEHTDHVSGLQSLLKKYQLPVYITENTLRHGKIKIEKKLITCFNKDAAVNIGNLSIKAFPKVHDCIDPLSFIVSSDKITVGVFTDIGIVCKNVIHYFKQCHAAFLETNYDDVMLDQGKYPYFLKKRISGGLGHLSNNDALQLFLNHRSSFLSHLILSHLSANNNHPDVVQQLFNKHVREVKIIIASRYAETEVYHIGDTTMRRLPTAKKSFLSAQLAFAFE